MSEAMSCYFIISFKGIMNECVCSYVCVSISLCIMYYRKNFSCKRDSQ